MLLHRRGRDILISPDGSNDRYAYDCRASCWRGHFNKLLYEDFGVYIEQIVVRSERVVRAPRLSDNLLYANRKPKDHKSA